MEKKYKILFINPGASLTGAPILFVNMLTWLKKNSSIIPFILTSGSGPLLNKYIELAQTYRWDGENSGSELDKYYPFRLLKRVVRKILPYKEKTFKEKLLNKLSKENFDLIYANSVASLQIFEEIKEHISTRTILHVHELQMSIIQFCGLELFIRNLPRINHFIVISEAVKKNLIEQYTIPTANMSLVYTFIDLSNSKKLGNVMYSGALKEQLQISHDAFLVVSSGTTDWRKGADLVVHIANKVRSMTNIPIHFIWIGGDNFGIEFQKLYYDMVKLNLHDRIHFMGVKENPLTYFAAADIFMLCSREEPVGIVALEAASLGKPILCFDQAGGMPEFVEDDCGFIIPYLDLDAMAEHIIKLQNDRPLLRSLGENAARKVQRHDINIACKEVESIINSVIES